MLTNESATLRHPVVSDPGGPDDLPEVAAQVVRLQRGAHARRKHRALLFPQRTRVGTVLSLLLFVGLSVLTAAAGNFSVRRERSVLVSP
jgi:hypothetical protein